MAGEDRLTLWDPFRELDLFPDWHPFRSLGLWPMRGQAMGETSLRPAVDVAETDEHYVVTAEVPGIRREDLTVELKDNVLTIRGEKHSERSEKGEQRRWSERVYGSFVRSFTLPANADPDRVSASFQDGVLTLEIQKREEAKPKVIHIGS